MYFFYFVCFYCSLYLEETTWHTFTQSSVILAAVNTGNTSSITLAWVCQIIGTVNTSPTASWSWKISKQRIRYIWKAIIWNGHQGVCKLLNINGNINTHKKVYSKLVMLRWFWIYFYICFYASVYVLSIIIIIYYYHYSVEDQTGMAKHNQTSLVNECLTLSGSIWQL